MLLRVIEIFLYFLLVWAIFLQVVIPLFMNRPVFYWFRRAQTEKEVAEAAAEVDTEALRTLRDELKRKLGRQRSARERDREEGE